MLQKLKCWIEIKLSIKFRLYPINSLNFEMEINLIIIHCVQIHLIYLNYSVINISVLTLLYTLYDIKQINFNTWLNEIYLGIFNL